MTERQKQHQGRSDGDDREILGRDVRADETQGNDPRTSNPQADIERGTDEVPAPNEERAPGHRDDMGAGR